MWYFRRILSYSISWKQMQQMVSTWERNCNHITQLSNEMATIYFHYNVPKLPCTFIFGLGAWPKHVSCLLEISDKKNRTHYTDMHSKLIFILPPFLILFGMYLFYLLSPAKDDPWSSKKAKMGVRWISYSQEIPSRPLWSTAWGTLWNVKSRNRDMLVQPETVF